MRKNDYMKELRKSEEMVGPLKIIKLPERSIPKFSEMTPHTVKKLWEFHAESVVTLTELIQFLLHVASSLQELNELLLGRLE